MWCGQLLEGVIVVEECVARCSVVSEYVVELMWGMWTVKLYIQYVVRQVCVVMIL